MTMDLRFLDPSYADGPIPGENHTTDERNYPWHRAPDFTDTDDALDYVVESLVDTREGFMYMNLIELDISIAACVDMILTKGISEGRWSIDFAIILAGPVARVVEIMAKSFELEYDLGVDDPKDYVLTAAGAKQQMQRAAGKLKERIVGIKATAPETTPEGVSELDEGQGLMAAPNEQDEMLGYTTSMEEENVDG